MELGLKNRTVLITGGSKGIGLACARAFVDEGARVAIASRDRGNLDRAGAQLGNVVMIDADLTHADQPSRMARVAEAALGSIDVLVNSAGAANSALMLASVGLASVYGRFGVRINAINPGATITNRIREALELEAKAKAITVDQVLEQGQARVPLGRYADPKEVASVTLFLASDQAAYVTGAVIPMDGGVNPII